jgi:hypothetical protein
MSPPARDARRLAHPTPEGLLVKSIVCLRGFAASLAVAALSAPVLAASAAPAAPGASPAASAPIQRTKMKTCNAAAKDKHGDERRAFMKQCLSKKSAASSAS